MLLLVVKKLQQSLVNSSRQLGCFKHHTRPMWVSHSLTPVSTLRTHTCTVVTHPTLQLCMARRISKLPPSAFIDIVPNVYVDCAWTAQSTRNAHTLLSHHHLKVVQLP